MDKPHRYRVAISNDRNHDIWKNHLKFTAKDYCNRGRQNPVSLAEAEFPRRFCRHLFPKGFVRIRRLGIIPKVLSLVGVTDMRKSFDSLC
ncbi:MAG: hypothetical protein EA394_10270 [Bacteroidia bacterium]|nr:MAG: hypothetical protein EA394_10270 [Bacteroidia bacterium]